ncbi:MAG: cysteine desulfurase [Myxococcota bacterium]|nr:cysteine desulfurase [Myxococcota bacterium]
MTWDGFALRSQFPTLHQEVNGQPLVYLDNGATTQKPSVVLEALERYYVHDNANVHRGVHSLSQRATVAYEAARAQLARLIGADQTDEVIFVRGGTEAINLVAQTAGAQALGPGDEVLITVMEHHSNIVPWQLLAERVGATVRAVPMDERGVLDQQAYQELLSERTKVVSLIEVSNALGTCNPIKAMTAQAKAVGALVLVDGCQAIPHQPVDVAELGCDFYVFSGHKMYGPTGIGVLWGRYELLAQMPPWQGGGDMIETVTLEGSTWAAPPARFEAGTPHIAGAIGLAKAAEFIMGLGLEHIAALEAELLRYATEQMGAIDGLRVIGTAPEKAGILSFVIDGVHPQDLGTLLDQQGVAIRTGHHCAQPAMAAFGVTATARASFGLYNTPEDVDRLVQATERAVQMLR